ncbi:LytR/AlgR family response regulator transcription factor [Algoriphagus aquimarinus]|uniref:DNA-binding response regulator, LytR/AlgR family n=1 Tax=Algoriphagus aquimarinus TaxID=237018 RepID=A0A1I1BCI8_9BACT|nr:response regulator transcription factor [Algoriphagus aquimarinus]SFB46458.1 DNA-binding response regulator, LytR/AlgR family [Algoriphagus aquimarinus]
MKEILQIGILDDELGPRVILAEHISGIPGFAIQFSTDDPFWALSEALNQRIDILITDIKMPGLSGLELAKKISHLNIPIIFCSVYDKYGVDSFKVNAVDYLLKPPKFFDVSEALYKAKMSIDKSSTSNANIDEDIILIKQQTDLKHVMLRPREIQFMEQQDVFTLIFLDSGDEIKTRSKFSSSLEKVNRPFLVRVHRSYAVNYLKIKALDQAYCYMEKGHKIPIGKEFRKEFTTYLHTKTVV